MKVQKFEEYSQSYMEVFCQDFLKGLLSDNLHESSSTTWDELHNKAFNDLKHSFDFIRSIDILPLYDFINSLVKNEKSTVTITPDMVVNMTICAVAITHVEDKRADIPIKEKELIVRDIQLELEEFRMQGIYGIVKKAVRCINSIRSIFNIISKHIGKLVYQFLDLFNYMTLLTPIIQILSNLIDKYKIDMEVLPGMLIGAGSGLTTLITNNYIVDLISKMKERFNLKDAQVTDIESALGAEEVTNIQPTVQKFSEFTPINDGELNNNVENEN
jgi:hypothetical protein